MNPVSNFFDPSQDTSYLSYLEPVVEDEEGSWSNVAQPGDFSSFSQLDFEAMNTSSSSNYFSLNNVSFSTPFLEEESIINN